LTNEKLSYHVARLIGLDYSNVIVKGVIVDVTKNGYQVRYSTNQIN